MTKSAMKVKGKREGGAVNGAQPSEYIGRGISYRVSGLSNLKRAREKKVLYNRSYSK